MNIVKIDAQAKSVNDLLSNKKYNIDYYQREYKWETKQITELLEDLEAKFLESYEAGHERTEVGSYRHYFLGSIIISNRDGKQFIIDGQQRLTSLTLLLIYLYHLQLEHYGEEEEPVQSLIFSKIHGQKSFNLDVPERNACLESLFKDQAFDPNGQSESVHNIAGRYADIETNFPAALQEDALVYFIDWLKNNVDLIEITTYSDDEAYTIFETMNDRGLSLSPTDMLKGYLLANIMDPEARNLANDLWRARLLELSQLGKEEDSDFFKAWLRAQFADSIRDRKKGAVNKDFEMIGTTFHKWVHDENKRIGLKTSSDFRDFVMLEFKSFSGHYMRVRQAAKQLTPGLEYVFYNAHNNFTLQYPLLLAPLRPRDDLDTANRKIRLVAGYLDIFIARRAVNFRTLDYSSIVYTMFNLMKEIRELDVAELVVKLKEKVAMIEETFKGIMWFRMNMWSKRYIHHILARITAHIEEQSSMASQFPTYVSRALKDPYEIEHIWADHYEQHADEFTTEEEFASYRNRIGNLLLLPGKINKSLNDRPYEYKLSVYGGQNVLAKTLDEQFYHNNPGFLAYRNHSGLPFRAHPTFRKTDLDDRQQLYRLICEEIWSPSRFDRELV